MKKKILFVCLIIFLCLVILPLKLDAKIYADNYTAGSPQYARVKGSNVKLYKTPAAIEDYSNFYFKFTKNRLKQFTNSYNMSIIFPHERSISAFGRLCGFFGVNQERKRLIDRIRQRQGI